MEQYEVYLHNVPKVSEEGNVIPIEPHQTQDFPALEEAQKFAAEQKDKFERVVVMQKADDKQTLIERYIDGEHVVAPPKEDDKAEEETSS